MVWNKPVMIPRSKFKHLMINFEIICMTSFGILIFPLLDEFPQSIIPYLKLAVTTDIYAFNLPYGTAAWFTTFDKLYSAKENLFNFKHKFSICITNKSKFDELPTWYKEHLGTLYLPIGLKTSYISWANYNELSQKVNNS